MARMIGPLFAAAMLLVPTLDRAMAQAYPKAQVKMFVGFPAGGTTDIVARDLGNELEKLWGHPVIVENRAGANGAIAATQLARLPADGQTLMMIVSGHVTNPLASSNAGYDALKDFTAISLVASSPLLIFSHPKFEATDIKALIKLAKEKPGTVSYSSPGVASIQQLSMEMLAHRTGAKFVHVPYRGGAPALNDVIAGHVPLSVMSVMQALPNLQANQVRALAVTSAKATDILPNTPSLAEVGVPNYEAELWYVVIAPAGLPKPIADKINTDITKIVKSEAFRKRLAAQGARPIGSTQAEVVAFMKAESDKWEKVIKDSNIKVQ